MKWPFMIGLIAGALVQCTRLAAAAEPPFLMEWGEYGTGPGQFISTMGVAVDDAGNVYVADMDNHRVQKFTATGGFVTQWGHFGDADGEFSNPTSVAADHLGHVYVLDNLGRIQKFTSDGSFLASWGTYGSEFIGLGIAVGPDNCVYAMRNFGIERLSGDGVTLATLGGRGSGPGQIANFVTLAVDAENHLYVADLGNARIQKFSAQGALLAEWNSTTEPRWEMWLATDARGYLHVTDVERCRVLVFDAEGGLIDGWGSLGTGPGEFNRPRGIAIDASGAIFVADSRIQKFGSPDLPTPITPCTWWSLKASYR